MGWNYKREESSFEPVPAGAHRVRIASADRVVSKNSGREMISMKLDVSGFNSSLFHYIVFMEDRPEITNRILTQLFDSFPAISPGDVDPANWVGKVGACQVKHEEYNGEMRAKISSFIAASKQDLLPPWKEPGESQKNNSTDGWMTPAGQGDNPFF